MVPAVVGDSLYFECKSQSLNGTVTWWKDDVLLLTDDSRYDVSPTGTLNVTNAQLEDNALFSCAVQSPLGSFSKSFAVLLQGKFLDVCCK